MSKEEGKKAAAIGRCRVCDEVAVIGNTAEKVEAVMAAMMRLCLRCWSAKYTSRPLTFNVEMRVESSEGL